MTTYIPNPFSPYFFNFNSQGRGLVRTMVASNSGPEPTDQETRSEQRPNSNSNCHLLNPIACFSKQDGVGRTFSLDPHRSYNSSLFTNTTRTGQHFHQHNIFTNTTRTGQQDPTTTNVGNTESVSCNSCMFTGMATCTGLSLYFFKMALLDLPEKKTTLGQCTKQVATTNKRFFLVCGTVWAAAGIYRYHVG
jgi:hypothetical protein